MPQELLRTLTGEGGIDRVLELARRHLDMDLAFLAEFTDGQQVYRGLAGDARSFGWVVDSGIPLEESYCRLMTAGELDHAIPDTAADPRVRDLAATRDANIGAYVGVPIRLADGSLYGSLCTLSHTAQPVDQRDARFLQMLAELVSADVQAARDKEVARAEIRELIDNARVEVALQPIFDVNSGLMLGVEALSRFPTSGTPDVVFAAAHAAGVGVELERLAAATAYDVLTLLEPDQYLAINLTPAVAIELAQLSTVADLPLGSLVLEITEHAAVESYQVLRDCLAPAREAGLRLAIDDAGAGYASLHHIVELHPDVIKIDRSLTDGVDRDTARQSVYRAFVTLAADLGAKVVAEGVERVEEHDAVRELGADAVQGFLLARPSTNRQDLRVWQAGRRHLPRESG